MTPATAPRRRKYAPGTCQDCGHYLNTTVVYFWLTGPSFPYRVCAQCIRPYRPVILKPERS